MLRSGTAAEHAALERSLDLLDPALDRARLTGVLGADARFLAVGGERPRQRGRPASRRTPGRSPGSAGAARNCSRPTSRPWGRPLPRSAPTSPPRPAPTRRWAGSTSSRARRSVVRSSTGISRPCRSSRSAAARVLAVRFRDRGHVARVPARGPRPGGCRWGRRHDGGRGPADVRRPRRLVPPRPGPRCARDGRRPELDLLPPGRRSTSATASASRSTCRAASSPAACSSRSATRTSSSGGCRRIWSTSSGSPGRRRSAGPWPTCSAPAPPRPSPGRRARSGTCASGTRSRSPSTSRDPRCRSTRCCTGSRAARTGRRRPGGGCCRVVAGGGTGAGARAAALLLPEHLPGRPGHDRRAQPGVVAAGAVRHHRAGGADAHRVRPRDGLPLRRRVQRRGRGRGEGGGASTRSSACTTRPPTSPPRPARCTRRTGSG